MSLELTEGSRLGTGFCHSPYKEFSPGEIIDYSLRILQTDGFIAQEIHKDTIEEIRTGGFFGKVLIPQNRDYVIKTSLPDPWHHFWRLINWNLRPFPAQSDELSAQLEHLSTRLIHNVLPVITKGKFYSPNSLGYTELSTGFAQVVETVRGRGPRFDLPKDEYEEFRKAQYELMQIGYDLGLEVVGQIHPGNPFGMANLWYDDRNDKWIWVDTIPAIPHTGRVKPFFYFKFHDEIREYFGEEKPTFNRIHQDKFMSQVSEHRDLFNGETFYQVMGDLFLYQRLHAIHEKLYKTEDIQIYAALTALEGFARDIFPEIAKLPVNILMDPIRITYDSNFRNTFLRKGIEHANNHNLITQEEYQDAQDAITNFEANINTEKRKYIILKVMMPFYAMSSAIINVLEVSSAGAIFFAENKLLMTTFAFFIGEVFPSLLRPATTYLIQRISKTDLRLATVLSAIPKYGPLLAVPAEISAMSNNETVWHSTVRKIISDLSNISPSGGTGSQLEARLYHRLGKPIENLGKKKIKTNYS